MVLAELKRVSASPRAGMASSGRRPLTPPVPREAERAASWPRTVPSGLRLSDTRPMAGHVFVSYSRKDATYVEALVAACAERGIEHWIDRHIDYGSRWANEIRDRVDACAVFVVVMTPEAEESEWVEREVHRAQAKKRPIMPLLLRGDEFFRLAAHQFEDVRDGVLPSEGWFGRIRELAPSTLPDGAVEREGGAPPTDPLGKPEEEILAYATNARAVKSMEGRPRWVTVIVTTERVIVEPPGSDDESFYYSDMYTLNIELNGDISFKAGLRAPESFAVTIMLQQADPVDADAVREALRERVGHV